jgi:hypothetical protein
MPCTAEIKTPRSTFSVANPYPNINMTATVFDESYTQLSQSESSRETKQLRILTQLGKNNPS